MLSHLPGYSLPERLWRTARRWALAWGRIVHLGAVMLVLVLLALQLYNGRGRSESANGGRA